MSAIIFLPGRPTSDSSDHAGKERQHDLYDSGHLLPPALSRREQRNCIFIPAISIHFWQTADQSRSKKVNRSDYHWRAGAASLHSSEREKPGETELRPSVVVKEWQFAPMTYDDENGTNPGVPVGGVPQNGYGQPGGAPVPKSAGRIPDTCTGRLSTGIQCPCR